VRYFVSVSAIFAAATSANVVGAAGASALLGRRVVVAETMSLSSGAATVASQSEAAVALAVNVITSSSVE
jgi:hypothetical protein